jgi:hypothetical protein
MRMTVAGIAPELYPSRHKGAPDAMEANAKRFVFKSSKIHEEIVVGALLNARTAQDSDRGRETAFCILWRNVQHNK